MIGFVGLSHLGIVYGAATAAKGFDMLGFDPDAQLCEDLAAGRLPVAEPGLDELCATHRARLHFSADATRLAACKVVFFSRDVPTDSENRSDLGPLRALLRLTVPHLAPDAIAVVLCQVPPGFTRSLLGEYPALAGRLFYQVETLIFGAAVERAMKPERYMIGCAETGAALPAEYAKWLHAFGCPLLPMRYESAELAKIAINCFLVSSVSTTNTLAEICERTGADWSEIAPALRLDRRIGPHAYLSPGLGIAGGNLERDLVTVQSLAAQHGTEAGIVAAWQRNSQYRRDWVLRKVQEVVLSTSASPRLAWWGLAYKQDTHSTKNSPSLALANALRAFTKIAYDPQVQLAPGAVPNLQQVATPLDACKDADALVVMTPWSEFRSVAPADIKAAMRGSVVVDPFRTLDPVSCREAGLKVHQLGVGEMSGIVPPTPLDVGPGSTLRKVGDGALTEVAPKATSPVQPLAGRKALLLGKNSYVGQFIDNHLRAAGAEVLSVGSADCNLLDPRQVRELVSRLEGGPWVVLFLAVINKPMGATYSTFTENVRMVQDFVTQSSGSDLAQFIYISSVDVYGRAPVLPITEETTVNPDTWYGLSKSTSEWIVENEIGSKCRKCVLRLPGIFGSSPNDRSVIGRLIGSIRTERKVVVRGDGHILRDYVFAHDVCRVVERLIRGKAHGTFNLSTGRSVSLLDILATIREVLGLEFEVTHLPADPERNFDLRFDNTKLAEALGDFEFTPLSEAIRTYE